MIYYAAAPSPAVLPAEAQRRWGGGEGGGTFTLKVIFAAVKQIHDQSYCGVIGSYDE